MNDEPNLLLEGEIDAAEIALRYPHVTTALLETPWAVTEAMRDVIVTIAARRIAGNRLTQVEIDQAIDGREAHREPRMISYELAAGAGGSGSRGKTTGQIAVLPFYGVMAPRLSGMSAMSGGTSVTSYMAQLKAALDDPTVSAILLEIDSPGGSSAMIEELGQMVFDARGEKPIAAIANTMAASAAYWVATQADELAVTPSGAVGSVGVYGLHQDLSAALERAGVKTTVIQAGKYKTELHPFGPMSEEALAYHQGVVDDVYSQFVEAVARGRGTTATRVKTDFGEGRMLQARNAVKAGMADRVATFDQMVDRLARGKVAAGKPSRGPRAEHLELAAEASSATGAARLDELLAGATFGALPAGTDLVIEIPAGHKPLTNADLEQMHEAVMIALPGRRVAIAMGGITIREADPAEPSEAAPAAATLPAPAGEPEQESLPASLLQRRAVRAAHQPPAAERRKEDT